MVCSSTRPTGGWNDGSNACEKIEKYMKNTGAIFKKKDGIKRTPTAFCRHRPAKNVELGGDPAGVIMDFDFLQTWLIYNIYFKLNMQAAIKAAANNPTVDVKCAHNWGINAMPLRSYIDHPPSRYEPIPGLITFDAEPDRNATDFDDLEDFESSDVPDEIGPDDLAER